MDSALDEFLKRYGDNDPNKFMTQNQKRPPLTSIETKSKGLVNIDPNMKIETGMPDNMPIQNQLSELSNDGASFGEKALAVGNKGLEMLPQGLQLISFAKGDQFDTSAEGGGPGKAGGAILQGAATGAQLGKNFGPLGTAIGATAGGLISTFAHKGAMKEWRENQKKHNFKLNALEKAKREDEYAMAEGLASMNALKGLREKQLGIIS